MAPTSAMSAAALRGEVAAVRVHVRGWGCGGGGASVWPDEGVACGKGRGCVWPVGLGCGGGGACVCSEEGVVRGMGVACGGWAGAGPACGRRGGAQALGRRTREALRPPTEKEPDYLEHRVGKTPNYG